MRLLEIRRAHPLNHRESLVHTFAYQNVLFQITSDRSCCRAETPRAHPEFTARQYIVPLGLATVPPRRLASATANAHVPTAFLLNLPDTAPMCDERRAMLMFPARLTG